MAKSRPSRARLFVALELPEATRAQTAGLLSAGDAWRPVAPESLHVTLVFLGWQAEEDIERIGVLTGCAVEGMRRISLAPARVRGVPPRRPRLVALDLEDPAGRCAVLHGALAAALAEALFYTREKRPFWPHVTLARVRRGHRVTSPPEAGPPPQPFDADRVVLYRSTLHPNGAVYEPLRVFTLEV